MSNLERGGDRARLTGMIDAIPPTPPALASVEAAKDVVRHYYAAVSARRYRDAYALWSGHRSYGAFVRGYAHTRAAAVRFVGPGIADVAMGSSYAELKVAVTARLNDGKVQRFGGTYTLRRVNDVDGSTSEQRRWHIENAKLMPTR